MSEALPQSSDDSFSLLETVGRCVLRLRKGKRLSRRLLSERSGVSPRYIAQLESGTGNVSIVLLDKIAAALECRLGALLSTTALPDVPPGSQVSADLLSMLHTADAQTLEQVRRVLLKHSAQRAQRICLIGLRGAGKSTLGRMAGEALQVPFVELNSEIEKIAGVPVAEIIALYGAAGYRDLEAEALALVIDRHPHMLLAAAGGIVGNLATFNTLLARCHCVWLKAAPEEHMQRVLAQGDTRPMQGNPAPMAQLRSLLVDREPLYSKAPVSVDTSGKTESEVLEKLLLLIKQQEFLRDKAVASNLCRNRGKPE